MYVHSGLGLKSFEIECHSRQASQTDGREEVDGEARVLGVVAREETFEVHRQRPERNATLQ